MAAALIPGPARAQRLGLGLALTRQAPYALWPAAALSWALLIAKSRNGGGDLFEIWKGIHNFDTGHAIYFQSGAAMSFLYPPSAALLMAPLGWLSFANAAVLFAIVQAVSIALACVVAARSTARLPNRVLLPLAVLAGSLLLPARNSMWLGNLDGILVALELLALVAAARNRWAVAGLLLGLSLAVKPVLLPLVLLFVLARQWRALAVAGALPLGLALIAVQMTADGGSFVSRVVPFLAAGQSSQLENVNIALAGSALSGHLPGAVVLGLRALAGALVALLVVLRWSVKWPARPQAVRLAEVSGLIMLGVLLTFSYAWAHYILFLLPLFGLYGFRTSVVRGYVAAIAAYLLLFPDDGLWARVSFAASQLRLTVGLLLLLASIAVVTIRVARGQAEHGARVAPAGS